MISTAPEQCPTNSGFYHSSQSYWQSLKTSNKPVTKSKITSQNNPSPPASSQIAIIGAGFAGLTTAIEILERSPQTRVVILERNFVGYGASGRNGGLISPLPAPVYLMSSNSNADHQWAIIEFKNRVTQTASWLRDTIGHNEVLSQPLSIQAMGPLTGTALSRIARDLDKIGIHCHLNSNTDFHSYPALTMDAHTINPFKLTEDLASYALKLGAQICEGINVINIDALETGSKISFVQDHNFEEKSPTKQTDLSTLRAKTVVICTNAYTADIKSLERLRAKPVYNFMVATKKLDKPMRDALAASDRFIVELNHAYAFYRLHDNRLIFGGIEKLNNKGAGAFDIPCAVFNQLRRQLKKSVPACADLEIEKAWSGKYHQTTVDLPIIRRSRSNPSIVFNIGYGGTGVAQTLTCARFAAATALNLPCQSATDKRLFDIISKTKQPLAATARFGLGCAYDLLRAPFQASK